LPHPLDHQPLCDAGGTAAAGEEDVGHPASSEGSHELVAAGRPWHAVSIGRRCKLAR
jgi:hypothetical protein